MAQERILTIKLSALGDFIQALGAMAAIRRHHKDAHHVLLTTKPFEGFARDCGYFDEIIIDERPKWSNIGGWLKLRQSLNDGGFARVYDLQNNDRTRLYYRLLSQKPEWIGAIEGASHFVPAMKAKSEHAFDRFAQALARVGIQDVEVDRLQWMQGDISGYALRAPYVLLVPGCAPTRPEKRWPHYVALANMLVEKGFQPVILGTDAEAEVTQEIAKACAQALDLTGQTSLAQIATLAQDAAGAIGNDTGPMHLIGPTGCPSLVLFSAYSDPVRHAPKGAAVDVLQQDPIEDLAPQVVLDAFAPRDLSVVAKDVV